MYSPLDVAVAISEGLSAKGHKVTYFGTKGSHLRVSDIQSSSLRPFIHHDHDLQELLSSQELFKLYLPSLYDQALVRDMFLRAAAGEYDILHFHHFESAMPYAALFPHVPVVYTLHDAIDPVRREILETFLSPNQRFISISNSQRRGAPDLPYAATVYNGIDTSHFVPNGSAEDYLLFVGRIIPEKGVKEAIQVALQCNSRLYIIGSVPPSEQWYFDTHVKPYLSDKILFLGFMDKTQLVRYYQKAKAVLMPVQWEEPFGLTMTEAMACGTPVIAFNRGSVPEIVIDGKTGFVTSSISEMVAAIKRIDTINRGDCREHALTHFSVGQMVDGYERVLQSFATPSKTTIFPQRFTQAMKEALPLKKPVRVIQRSTKTVALKVVNKSQSTARKAKRDTTQ